MEHFVEKLEIKNFKSIRDLTLTDFRRINLFIGRPNVGKSNLLEALGMFTLWGLKENVDLANILRIEKPIDLFFEGRTKEDIDIIVHHKNHYIRNAHVSIDNQLFIKLESVLFAVQHDYLIVDSVDFYIDNEMKISEKNILNDPYLQIKKYIFNHSKSSTKTPDFALLPPYGENLMEVIEGDFKLRKTIGGWFKEYNLRLVLDRTSNSLKIQKEVGDNEVFILPYSMIADTLQRLIFYKTAVASNQNSVLIFEEPEAHAYPPYIAEFTQEVIKSETNQFFIATHSPIVVNDFLENAREDLSIFITDFKDGQTVARALTREELEEVYNYGVDLFFNNEAYVV